MNKWFDNETQDLNLFKRSNTYQNVNNNILINNIRNGRVDILGNNIPTSSNFPVFQQSNKGNVFYQNEALKTILTSTDKLQQVFFSRENVKIIQNNLRQIVYKKSGHVIQNQSYDNLFIIMRSIYLQYSKHINTNIKAQIKELNQLVYNYSIPNILSNIEQYIGYKKEMSTLPVPLQHPKYLSNQGLKSMKINIV